jgi:hypothetical protein
MTGPLSNRFGIPDDVTCSNLSSAAIAAAVASKSAGSLYDLVKGSSPVGARPKRHSPRPKVPRPTMPRYSRSATNCTEQQKIDPEFTAQLQAAWQVEQHADQGGVASQITGTVTGKVLQARDIHGGITF